MDLNPYQAPQETGQRYPSQWHFWLAMIAGMAVGFAMSLYVASPLHEALDKVAGVYVPVWIIVTVSVVFPVPINCWILRSGMYHASPDGQSR